MYYTVILRDNTNAVVEAHDVRARDPEEAEEEGMEWFQRRADYDPRWMRVEVRPN